MQNGGLRMSSILVLLIWAIAAAPAAHAQQIRAATADELRARAIQLYDTGDYIAGLKVAQQALQLREKLVGEHPDTAKALMLVGNFQLQSANYAAAEQMYQRALTLRMKLLGAEHPDTIALQNNLAIVYSIRGNYAKAEQMYQQALAVRERTLGRQHLDVAQSLQNLGALYFQTSKYPQARAALERALQIREAAGPANESLADVLANLGSVYELTGDYNRAESLYERALTIKRQVLNAGHPSIATVLNKLGHLYMYTGAYAKAETVLLEALAIDEKALGPNHPQVANALNTLALIDEDLHGGVNTERFHRRTLAIREQALGPDHPMTALSLYNLGTLERDRGHYEAARRLHERALKIRQRKLGQDHVDTADSLEALSKIYADTGDFTRAVTFGSRAVAVRERIIGKEHPEVGTALAELGSFYWSLGQADKALPILLRAQRVSARAIEQFALSGNEARIRAFLVQEIGLVDHDVSFSLATKNPAGAALGLTSVLQYKGRALDAAADNVSRLRNSLRPEDRALFSQLADVANQLSVLTYQAGDAGSAPAYRERAAELARQQDQLETRLAQGSREFQQQATIVTLPRVQAAIPAEAALIEWLKYVPFAPKTRSNGAPRYVAYVLRHTGNAVAVDLGAAEPIETLLSQFRIAAGNPELPNLRSLATALHQKLFAPLEPHTRGARQLLLSPDATLNLTPMAALVNAQGRYLIEQFEISYLTSGRDLLRVASREPTNTAPVVMADPDYGSKTAALQTPALQRSADLDRSGLVFRSLPGTALEAQAIKTLLRNDVRMFVRGTATEANLKQVHRPRILHLATHGFFLEPQAEARPNGKEALLPTNQRIENPLLRSGLALAGANARRSGSKDDGILTALEAAQLDLRGTQLVVLSACATGLGDVRTGDGVAGLRRGLLLAGAQTQVAALWSVPDAATQQLMVDFYQYLVRGAGRAAALRRAQLDMLATSDHSHPYYWANFAVIGAWTPLTATP